MFVKNYIYLALLLMNMMCCLCYVNYELFGGFDSPTTDEDGPNDAAQTNTTDKRLQKTTMKAIYATETFMSTVKTTMNSTINATVISNNTIKTKHNETTSRSKMLQRPSIKVKKFNHECPENERPLSIGTFEIPTQRDLVFFTKRTLLKLFNSYHEKTLYLLKDIKEATRATVDLEKKCRIGGKITYKKCVKQVSKKCVSITKELVASLELQKEKIAVLTEDKICDMSSMDPDPIQLIKTLAMDEALLDFALPAFLRLLGECTIYCFKPSPPDYRPRLRRLTDQDLVVRHFLTRKNYVELLKDTNTYV